MAGIFLLRVCVFLDYQNIYMQARRSFCSRQAPAAAGQVDPLRLAGMLAGRVAGPAELTQVRVYRGVPLIGRDQRAHDAATRQVEAWRRSDSRVQVLTRPLRYPRDYPRARPQEKGIDVMLAVDFVRMAVQGEYDVGVLMSHDTDLVPALEAVAGLSRPRCEIAAWSGPRSPRLRVPGAQLWCHYLTPADYAAVADPRDYTR